MTIRALEWSFAMAPLDSTTAQQDTLTLLDQTLRGERLSVDSADKKWPLRQRILIVLVASAVPWVGIYFVVRSVL